MGVARLLAKAWIVFCIFAGVYALQRELGGGAAAENAGPQIALCVLLFGAMGLLFVGGYGISGNSDTWREGLKLDRLLPSFNGLVFVFFALVSLIAQTAYLPLHATGGALSVLHDAIFFFVPGQRALEGRLDLCGIDGGRTIASAFAWLLAFIYLGSALSRVRLSAGIVRLERKAHPGPINAASLTLLLGLFAAIGIEFLFVGAIFPMLPCDMMIAIPGQFLVGLAPLMLAYLIAEAITDLLALNPEA